MPRRSSTKKYMIQLLSSLNRITRYYKQVISSLLKLSVNKNQQEKNADFFFKV